MIIKLNQSLVILLGFFLTLVLFPSVKAWWNETYGYRYLIISNATSIMPIAVNDTNLNISDDLIQGNPYWTKNATDGEPLYVYCNESSCVSPSIIAIANETHEKPWETKDGSGHATTVVWEDDYLIVYHNVSGNDSSPQSNDGALTITGTHKRSGTGPAGCIFGDCWYFGDDNCGGGISVGTTTGISTTEEYSVCFWAYQNGTSHNDGVVSYIMDERTSGMGWVQIRESGGGLEMIHYSSGPVEEKYTATFDPDRWYYWCQVWNGTHVYRYRNGTLITASIQTSGSIYSSASSPLHIGCSDNLGVQCWGGTIDEYWYINKSMSDVWVQEQYWNGINNLTKTTVPPSNTVTLNVPSSGSSNNSATNYFKYTPIIYQTIHNCSIYTNETGWGLKQTNSTEVANNTINGFSITFNNSDVFEWNVGCYNSTNEIIASSNWTLKVDLPPVWRNNGTNDTDNKIEVGEAINLTTQWEDIFGVDFTWLWTNETEGTGMNYTEITTIGVSGTHLEPVDTNGVGRHSSVAIDANGYTHIAYWDYQPGDMKYCNNTEGSWLCEIADEHISASGVMEESDIAIDSSGGVHISLQVSGDNDLRYCNNTENGWTCVNLTTLKNMEGANTGIAIDKNDRVHIVSANFTGQNIIYCNNTLAGWICTTPEEGENIAITDDMGIPSIAIDSNNGVHIVYNYDETPDRLRYCNNTEAGDWTCVDVGSTAQCRGQYPSIALDSNDKVYISHKECTNNDLEVCNNSGAGFTCVKLDSGGNAGSASAIAIDTNDDIHISYLNVTGGNNYVSYCNTTSGTWNCVHLGKNSGSEPLGYPGRNIAIKKGRIVDATSSSRNISITYMNGSLATSDLYIARQGINVTKTKHYNSPKDMNDVKSWSWSNFTWQNSSIASETKITWKIYANDTYGNENVTTQGIFTVGTATTTTTTTSTTSTTTESSTTTTTDGEETTTTIPVSCSDTITTFNDSTTFKNLTFTEAGNQTVYITIPSYYTVDSAYLNITLYQNPSNCHLNVGNDSDIEWNITFKRPYLNKSVSGNITNATNAYDNFLNDTTTYARVAGLVDIDGVMDYYFNLGSNVSSIITYTHNGTSGGIRLYNFKNEVFDIDAYTSSALMVNSTNLQPNYINSTGHVIVRVDSMASGNNNVQLWDVHIRIMDTEFNHRIPDFSSELNDILLNCDCDGCSLENNCTIPLVFHSDELGIFRLDDINISVSFGLKIRAYDEDTLEQIYFDTVIFNETDSYTTNNTWELSTSCLEIPVGNLTIIVKNDSYVDRYYYLFFNQSEDMNTYILKESDGIYITFLVIDDYNEIQPNTLVSARRYLNGSWKTVAQLKADDQGKGWFFLSPWTNYKIQAEKNFVEALIDSYYPNSNYVLTIVLSEEALPYELTYLLDDISYFIEPNTTYVDNTTRFKFYISSSSSSLEYFGLNITWVLDRNSTLLYNQTDTTPSGGEIWVDVNITNLTINLTNKGKIDVVAFFKKTGYNLYEIRKKYIIWFEQSIFPPIFTSLAVGTFGLSLFATNIISLIASGGLAMGINKKFSTITPMILFLGILAIFVVGGWFGWYWYLAMILLGIGIIILQRVY